MRQVEGGLQDRASAAAKYEAVRTAASALS